MPDTTDVPLCVYVWHRYGFGHPDTELKWKFDMLFLCVSDLSNFFATFAFIHVHLYAGEKNHIE